MPVAPLRYRLCTLYLRAIIYQYSVLCKPKNKPRPRRSAAQNNGGCAGPPCVFKISQSLRFFEMTGVELLILNPIVSQRRGRCRLRQSQVDEVDNVNAVDSEPEDSHGQGCPFAPDCSGALPAVLERALGFALLIAFAQAVALVVQLLALYQRNLYFNFALFVKIHLQRHEGLAALAHLAVELFDLGTVQQQLAPAQRLVVEAVGIGIGADVGVDQKNFIAVNAGIAFLQVHPSLAAGFDFAALQLDAGLIGIEDFVLVPGFFILRNEFCFCHVFFACFSIP